METIIELTLNINIKILLINNQCIDITDTHKLLSIVM